MIPFHLDPAKELDPTNLVTLCMSREACHIDLGHGGSFDSYNPFIIEDALEFRKDRSARERLKIEAKARVRRLR